MSQINVQQDELSINERNSITGSQSAHNLTGPRARFQPVRIKALLDLFESDDDDTEPRDSEDDSDAESLQALPNDDDDDDIDDKERRMPRRDKTSSPLVFKKKETSLIEANSKASEKKHAISSNNVAIEDKTSVEHELENRDMKLSSDVDFDKGKDSSHISQNSSSFELKKMVLPLNQKKTTFSGPFKHIINNNKDRVGSSKETVIPNPQAPNDAAIKKGVGQNMISDKRFEMLQQDLNSLLRIDSGDRCAPNTVPVLLGSCKNAEKAKEQSYQHTDHSTMQTPMKHAPIASIHPTSCSARRNIIETPQAKSHNNEYIQNNVETPGLIFSHWSRNNFLKTPTQYQSQVLASREGTGGQHINQPTPDLRSQIHRFYPTSNNRVVRRPLSEAMHLNQGSSSSEIQNNQLVEHQNPSRALSYLPKAPESSYNAPSELLAKENCPLEDKKNAKINIVDKMMHPLPENQNPQSASSASLIKDEKINSQISFNGRNDVASGMSSISKEQPNYELILNKNCSTIPKVNSNEFTADKAGCEKLQTVLHNSEDKLKMKNKDCEGSSMAGKEGRLKIELPLSLDRGKPPALQDAKSDPENPVQFSVASKAPDKKHGKIITVKGSNYLVLGKLGQGMSGEVLRVQEATSGELRAIKCVDLSRIEKETAQGCLEEVSMLDRLRAPCIINMFTYEIKSHLLYVVMEMGDTDLSKLLKSMSREKQLPLTMILYYWTEMLTAVKHIHDNGVIHSDLKPANFLLVRGRLKLIDFGIASTVNADMTSVVKNTSLGTLNYISPEAIIDIGGNCDSSPDDNKYKINFKSDVWSLGCILYSLVYGQTPFQHIRADWAKVTAITNPNQKISFPPSESLSRRGYTSPPAFLVDIMKRCLQHDRRARPTVEQLLQIPYIGCNCPPASSLPNISPSILSKIKQSLEESEWRQLLEVLERRKPLC